MDRRAQTTFDYAVGMSLFLLVLVGVFAFLPSLFAPFTADRGANTVTADRSASRLADDLLTTAGPRPSVLDEDCTAAFFDSTRTVPSKCAYESNDQPVDALGVPDSARVNVTIETGSGIRTLDGSTDLAIGPTVPDTVDEVTATRVVLLGGEQNRLYVRVW